MPFDAEAFQAADLQHRTADVLVPALASFFGADAPVWRVRGLTASELNLASDAARRRSNIDAVVQSIAANAVQVDAARKVFGLSKDTPGEIAKRLEMLVAGSVEPKIDLPVAVRLAEKFPGDFISLTEQIAELTGQGALVGKPEAVSQATPAS